MKQVPRESGFQKGKIKIKAEWEQLLPKDMECKEPGMMKSGHTLYGTAEKDFKRM